MSARNPIARSEPRAQRADDAGLGQAAVDLDAERLETSATSEEVRTSSKATSGWRWKSWRQATSS